jgi:signal transduction histidine kinase
VTLRNLLFRFGAAGEALSEADARLAAAEAVESERARLAREMHDSVAKTLHGLALAADALAASADHCDPGTLKRQANLVAGAARRAAAESRDLLSDLRRRTDLTTTRPDLTVELKCAIAEFTARTTTEVELSAPQSPLLLPYATAHHVLAIVSEALENTHRHAHATRVRVELTTADDEGLDLRVQDDGVGLPPATAPEDLAKTGHFGLLGMSERATSLGGRLGLGRSPLGGAEIHLHVPLRVTFPPTPQEEAAHA